MKHKQICWTHKQARKARILLRRKHLFSVQTGKIERKEGKLETESMDRKKNKIENNKSANEKKIHSKVTESPPPQKKSLQTKERIRKQEVPSPEACGTKINKRREEGRKERKKKRRRERKETWTQWRRKGRKYHTQNKQKTQDNTLHLRFRGCPKSDTPRSLRCESLRRRPLGVGLTRFSVKNQWRRISQLTSKRKKQRNCKSNIREKYKKSI